MTEILILSAGRRVSLVRAFQAAANPHGLTVVTADMHPHMSSACHVAEKTVVLPHVTDLGYPDALLDYCRINTVCLIVPTIDTELAMLSALRPQLLSLGCIAVVSDEPLIATCRDKRKTAVFFQTMGLVSPQIYAPNALSYPTLVKPYDGSLSTGISVLRSEQDYTAAVKGNPKNIFCQYLDPSEHDEYTCDAYFNANGVICCVVPRLRIEVRGGEVSKGRTERNNIVPYLFEKLSLLEGARGCLTIQIMRHRETGELFLIEINPRFGGGYPLTAQSGASYHSWLIAEYILGHQISKSDDWADQLTMLRYDAEVFISNV